MTRILSSSPTVFTSPMVARGFEECTFNDHFCRESFALFGPNSSSDNTLSMLSRICKYIYIRYISNKRAQDANSSTWKHADAIQSVKKGKRDLRKIDETNLRRKLLTLIFYFNRRIL